MQAFLSHSSVNKDLVIAVQESLSKDATWLDRAEIEWGDLFLEKISEGIASSTDFVLFWSAAAASSEWVRLEINMAFIQALRLKAIRLRVIVLDATPLPLYLQPYHSFSVIGSHDPGAEIIEKLAPLLREPVRAARARFINRNNEISRIESAVDDPETSLIWLFGFTGVGKRALAVEAQKRIFEGAEPISIDITQGTGLVELVLALSAEALRQSLPESLTEAELIIRLKLCMETIASEGRLIVIANVQHWLNEDGEPSGPLPTLLDIICGISAFVSRPVFLTSTRRPELGVGSSSKLQPLSVKGLDDEHTAVLVRNWYYAIYGTQLDPADASKIAPKLFGHPLAARLVAGVLGNHSADYLELYPRELISLRRDLARTLLQDLQLSRSAERLMESLALVSISLPATVLAADGFTDEEFQQAVEQCANAGLITANVRIEGHPLFQEFFWHRLHRTDYQERAMQMAEILRKHLAVLEKESREYADLIPVTFRLFALAGDIETARTLRQDLVGELEAAAIVLYNRRNYALADAYIGQVLDITPKNWRMRLYRARVRIRQEDWMEADRLIGDLLNERSRDAGALHLKGWRLLKQRKLKEALDTFLGIISDREHIASLRDAAECLHRMQQNEEALIFLRRAKLKESENPFVLDLESRILEDMNQLPEAYRAAELAAARDPLNSQMRHRLGQICSKQDKLDDAIKHFEKALELDHDGFSPANSLASAYLDKNDAAATDKLLPTLKDKARTPGDRALLEHLKARTLLVKGELPGSREILEREIARNNNVVPNLGLLAQVELAAFDQNIRKFPTIADLALKSADRALEKIVQAEKKNRFIDPLSKAIAERRNGTKP